MGTSRRIESIYDQPLWASIQARAMRLQRCVCCGHFRYPPAPICARCLSDSAEWLTLQGRGTILSWVIFHRQYFDDFAPPYNAIAVQLAEGPIIVSNLVGVTPPGDWIGSDVELIYERGGECLLPRFKLRAQPLIDADRQLAYP
ncbi:MULTISPECIES: Zn-ribbon domain-containing OB-fold protein [Paraburkholderia]|uniref:OB-fold domain-containing protein n=1 Tax=Paraburkholderia metrosideri TaxID=580937 RepID=A0ABW9E653_9BURK